ncbi:excinuclease ABC, C subunit [Hyphomicrobium denitrificans ATCC 51888]|uniref:UvrABC system protein C n=1 Tax=Hyphomicrobium denitrificans (strain ATCC 51888 / DSM 1869 / NCIMB 11706 / TK 0415) TaxID=582899 RepID=D8JPS8_HYPDA|nr:excinuclease ABC subunit UvrC [Hyphomicrobium denitrificans]ADJ23812.1 excinuclease ABC, C subunit [Hyphomicrobium denitrificans ATCC 51888]
MTEDQIPAGHDAGSEAPAKTGADVIAGYLKTLPQSPGVYRMLDTAGEVIYVGKARQLKSRVSNYARLNGHTNRIARMILATASMEFVTVSTEAEALLLEANLIKRFRPRFNVLMRDDKSFPYILIARDHPAPAVMKHRGARNRKGEYFGPFASAGAVDRTVNMLQRAFLLRSCSDSVYESRTRPCLLYQIKRCSAPCTGEIQLDDYRELVVEAERFLKGESQSVRAMYQQLMQEAADALEFETAAKYRNRLWALAHVTADQAINPDGVEEADVFAAYQDGGQTCIQVFFFRTGQNWGNRAYYPKADRSLDAPDVLDSFIAQFYDDKPVPRLILISHDIPNRALLAEALASKAQRKVEIRVPARGTKSSLVEHALTNAREALGRKLAESSTQARLLEGVAERFALAAPPRRIEVFDNSHIAGTNAVGAMIVAGPEGFVKGQYRKFNIKSPDVTPGDDYAMMREVLTRRFKRIADAEVLEEIETEVAELVADTVSEAIPAALVEQAVVEETTADDDVAFPDRPDLVLIDGGLGQLSVAREVLAGFGLHDIQLIGVAKGPDRDAGREHFHIPGREQPIMLETRDPVLYFVQRLRDEAHRFAIGTHRAKRAKALGVNPLDEIDGIGPTRKRALLKHFGSAKAVSRAGIEDLKAVEGISADMARRIYDFFHDRSV